MAHGHDAPVRGEDTGVLEIDLGDLEIGLGAFEPRPRFAERGVRAGDVLLSVVVTPFREGR